MSKSAIYPGCSLEGTANSFEVSLELILDAMGVQLEEVKDWSCCGASSAHALDHNLHLCLTMRNLALAEQQGYDEIIAPCAACYHRLASSNTEIKNDPELLAKLNADTGLDYKATVKVRNVLDYLANVLGTGKIAAQVKTPLNGMKVACYYGCLNTRVPRGKAFDDVEYPMSMDRVVEALGADAIKWGYKTECCGASLFVTSESTANELVSKILKDALIRGADCIAVACPMCHNNLDTKQADIRAEFGVDSPIPVVFVPQLIGLAFGLDQASLKLRDSFVPFNLELSRA